MNNTLRKGLEIIELLAHSERPLTLTEISDRRGCPAHGTQRTDVRR